ncbi:MAG: lipopolysaccharide heptosyltransferase II [Candidatus Woesearchaeota archaeon]
MFTKKKINEHYKKLLLVAPPGIGDTVMLTPAIRELRKRFPTTKIYCICTKWSSDILSSDPNVDELIRLDDKKFTSKSPLNLIRLIRLLRKYHFDVAVSFLMLTWPLITYFAGIPVRVGPELKNEGFALTKKSKYHLNKHVVENFLSVVSLLGAEITSKTPKIFLSKEDKDFSEEFITRNRLKKEKLIGISAVGGRNPGSFTPSKIWPKENFKELCKQLEKVYNPTFIFFGDKYDSETSEYISKDLKKAHVLCGKTTLRQAAALIEKCNLFITPDSGLMHIAGAVNTRVIGLFGPTNPNLYFPFSEKNRFLWKKIDCSPCFATKEIKKCNSNRCMQAIQPEEVFNLIRF